MLIYIHYLIFIVSMRDPYIFICEQICILELDDGRDDHPFYERARDLSYQKALHIQMLLEFNRFDNSKKSDMTQVEFDKLLNNDYLMTFAPGNTIKH